MQMLERPASKRRMDCLSPEGDEWLDAAANARLVKNAEAYYRVMYYGAAESWNLRDTHMFETLCQLLEAKGPDAKAVVWAHNSHIGNAAHTEMGQVREELNIGQLCQGEVRREARLIGFGTHTGTVAAATDWDEPMEVKTVRPSLAGSYERLCHDSGVPRFLLDLREGASIEALRQRAAGAAAGAVHRRHLPARDRALEPLYRRRAAHQFDAWVWFDETEAVTPLRRGAASRRGRDLSVRIITSSRRKRDLRGPAETSGA